MRVVKRLLKRAVRQLGYELCRLDDVEARQVPIYRGLSYKEAQCYRALSNLAQLSVEECRLLGELVRESDPARPIIEIGTLFGHSTIMMSAFKVQAQVLITVDNYSWNPLGISPDAHYQITVRRLSEVVDKHNVEIVRMDKDEFYRTYQGPPPALFFCDADHSYEATTADIVWARSVGASVICGDDYDLAPPSGVREAIDKMGGPHRLAGGLFVL